MGKRGRRFITHWGQGGQGRGCRLCGLSASLQTLPERGPCKGLMLRGVVRAQHGAYSEMRFIPLWLVCLEVGARGALLQRCVRRLGCAGRLVCNAGARPRPMGGRTVGLARQ